MIPLRFPHYVMITFGLFMAFILFLVFKTSKVNNELVTEDYYKQELDYQNKIDKMGHVRGTGVTISQSSEAVLLQFPDSMLRQGVKGSVEFYRPSDASKDVKLPLALARDGRQLFPKGLFAKGLYTLKMDWSQKGVDYYQEQEFYVR